MPSENRKTVSDGLCLTPSIQQAIKRNYPKRYIDGQIQKGGEVNFAIFKHFQFGVFPW